MSSTKHSKNTIYPSQPLPKTEEGKFSNPFYKASMTLILKPENTTIKEVYRPISQRSTAAKPQQNMSEPSPTTQEEGPAPGWRGFTPGVPGWPSIPKSICVVYNDTTRDRSHMDINWFRKRVVKFNIHEDGNCQQRESRGNVPQHN